MLQALRPEGALAIAEVSRRRSRDEQAMAQYLNIGRGAGANGAPPGCTLLRLPGDVDLAVFESEERRRNRAAFARRPTRAHSAYLAGTAAVIEFWGGIAAYAPHPAGGAARLSYGHTARALHRRRASQARLPRLVTAEGATSTHDALMEKPGNLTNTKSR